MVYFDEIASAVFVIAVNTKKGFNGLLLQAGKAKMFFVWFDPFVYVDAVQVGKGVGESQRVDSFFDEWNIESIAVEVDQGFVVLCESKKAVDDIGFGFFCIGKPLDKAGGPFVEENAADQVDGVVVAGEASGFDVEKEKVFWVSQAGERVGFLKGEIFFYSNHGGTPKFVFEF